MKLRAHSGAPIIVTSRSVTTTSGSNDPTAAEVVFEQAFNRTPNLIVSPPDGAEGTYDVTSECTTSCQVEITGEASAVFSDATFSVDVIGIEPS